MIAYVERLEDIIHRVDMSHPAGIDSSAALASYQGGWRTVWGNVRGYGQRDMVYSLHNSMHHIHYMVYRFITLTI